MGGRKGRGPVVRPAAARWLAGAPPGVADVFYDPAADEWSVVLGADFAIWNAPVRAYEVPRLRVRDDGARWEYVSQAELAVYLAQEAHRRVRWLDLPHEVRSHVLLRLPVSARVDVGPRSWGAVLSAAEFDRLAAVLQGPGGRSRAAARLVLVDGVLPAEAARRTGVTQPAVARVVKRVLGVRESGCPACGRPVVSGAGNCGGGDG